VTSEAEQRWQVLRENPTGFVKIVCQNGELIHAELLIAHEDIDGNRDIVFDVLWSSRPEFDNANRGCSFALNLDDISVVEPLSKEIGNEYLKRQSDLRT